MITISMPEVWMFILPRLRKYLKKDPSVKILNVHGKGYKLI